MRPNFWVNTPDILHETLQRGGRPAFKMRLALAATLSSLYGIYSGYELCENVAREPGSEEYLNSEKYEYKVRDWDAPGNLVGYVTRINRIRRENRALHLYRNLRFFGSDDPNVLFYAKMTPERDNLVFVAANLDPFATHAGLVDVPIAELGIGEHQAYRMHELITDRWFEWAARLRGAEPGRRARADLRPSPLRRRARRRRLGRWRLGRREDHGDHAMTVLVEVDEQPFLVEEELLVALLADAGRRTPAVQNEFAVEDLVRGLEPERAHDLLAVARGGQDSEVDGHPQDAGGRLGALVQPLDGVVPLDLLDRLLRRRAVAGADRRLIGLARRDPTPLRRRGGSRKEEHERQDSECSHG